jgi:hypothetical protein
LQVFAFLPDERHEPEQHWLLDVQDVPVERQVHAASVLQAESAQSTRALQLSSRPLPQVSLGAAQSVAQFEQFSAPVQVSVPQQ